MKTIFHFNPETGGYIGRALADKDPATGDAILPANATTQEPPAGIINPTFDVEAGVWNDAPEAAVVSLPEPEAPVTPAEPVAPDTGGESEPEDLTEEVVERSEADAVADFGEDVPEEVEVAVVADLATATPVAGEIRTNVPQKKKRGRGRPRKS